MKYISLLFFFSILGCKSTKYTANNLPEKQLIFGKGGGFSGEIVSYILLENGQLFEANSLLKITNEVRKINKKECKKHFQRSETTPLFDANINYPSNVYYFITYKEADKQRQMTWGAADFQAPVELKQWYQELQQLVKK